MDVLTVNLQDVGQHSELGGGALYINVQRKLSETLLAHYNRWVFENHHPETVETLRTFINQEAEFLSTASETVRGIIKEEPKKNRERTFVTQAETPVTVVTESKHWSKPCQLCHESHGLWKCDKFKAMNNDQRWDEAKRLKVCRCLGDNHHGQNCPRSRLCELVDASTVTTDYCTMKRKINKSQQKPTTANMMIPSQQLQW